MLIPQDYMQPALVSVPLHAITFSQPPALSEKQNLHPPQGRCRGETKITFPDLADLACEICSQSPFGFLDQGRKTETV